jgi:hypothetical protein
VSHAYLGDKLRHELDDSGIISKLPQKHHDLLHLNAILILSKDIVDQTT